MIVDVLQKKEWSDTKISDKLKNPSRDLLVLLKNEFMSEKSIEQEVDCLNEILHRAESPESFCLAHELVNRNRITQHPFRILKAIRQTDLKPFRFLINKN
jgi:hypothetical protein